MVHLQALQPNVSGPERPLPGIRRVKLAVPEPAPGAVPRSGLEARLERAADLPLTLVIAGAGYGKTPLLASWARTTGRKVAWLSLDGGDADLRRFARLIQ